MKIPPPTEKEFALHPPYTGPAVCVDVTPLKKTNTPFGEKEKFRLVFETGHFDEAGNVLGVWSTGFVLSLHEKSGLRKFVKQWWGRDLTESELQNFDTDCLLGQNGFIVVTHSVSDDGKTTYANIASCTPLPANVAPIKPSGKFKRMQDRPKSPGSSYRRTDPGAAPAEDPGKVFLDTKVHLGNAAGTPVRDLSIEQIDRIAERWLPGAKANPHASADDKRLVAAIEWVLEERKHEAASKAATPPPDDFPF